MFPTADTEDITRVTSLTGKSSATSDAEDAPENSEVSTQPHSRELTNNMLLTELIFCSIALALTTYGALHNTGSKISKHPQAIRFFKPDSVVTDWYRGQLSNALAFINRADVSFVMYYAPWDAESQYVREEFEQAAIILQDRVKCVYTNYLTLWRVRSNSNWSLNTGLRYVAEVHFSAVNCWNPGSECRLQHNKIPSWPILMAYTVNSRGVLYKGPRDAHSIINFLELIMRPLKRVSATDDLVNLLSICDAVAVGYTPVSDTSKYYNIWYQVALKSREFDTVGEICFAVVTSEDLAADLGVNVVPNARLMLWNDTKEYMSGESDLQLWNDSSLMQWVLENFSQPVARIIPMWKKAFSFERYVDGNPILILFTPLNPLYEQLPSYALLREVAMEYYNCKNNDSNPWTSELMKLQQVQRLLYQQKNFTKICEEYKFKKPARKHSRYFKKEIESHNNKYPWLNSTQRSTKSGVFNFLVKRGLDISKAIESTDDTSQLLSSLGLLHECSTKVLPAERSFYDNYDQCQSIEEQFNFEKEISNGDVETTMLPFEDDPLSPENLVQDNVKHFCKLIRFAQEWGPHVYPQRLPEERRNLTYVHGLSCEHNFSLNMLAVDSVRNHHFAESLGIDIASKKDMTAVIILDSKHETQYVLSEEYSAKSVREFILNFTAKRLKRSLRTHVPGAAHTHYFDARARTERAPAREDDVHIIDLTTRTFRRVVNTPGTLTLVAICGGACGARTSLALAAGARLLRACGTSARAARLDALRHDLPWHYTAHTHPALLVFPADRALEGESRSYPLGARVSAGGVVALALRALPAPRRLRVRLALCAHAQTNTEKKNCIKDIREHITMVIERNLKYWRQTDDQKLRDALFKRLEHLHQVSLKLSLINITDLRSDSAKQTSLIDSLSILSKSWDIDVSTLRRNVTTESSS